MKKLSQQGIALKFLSNYWIIIAAFFLWFLLFHKFFFGELSFILDACSYYDHIKFFIEGLATGEYPLWNPTWNNGIPNEFFLRRMGDVNPFFSIILSLYKLGIPYRFAYLAFLAIYYIIGMLGFYKLSEEVFYSFKSKKLISIFSLLLLLFSSLTTRLFVSYIILIFVPMVWFFFFLLRFIRNPKPYALLGMVLSFMIEVTTYIPFYFLTVVLTFFISIVLFYPKRLLESLNKVWDFIKSNKLVTAICLMLVLISLIPGASFFKEASKGDFVLPVRNRGAVVNNVLGVDKKRTEPGLFSHIKIDKMVSNLKDFELNVFYVPIFLYLVLCLSVINLLNKRLLFLCFWGILLFLISSSEVVGLNKFLYEHVFYFKYFRNLRFFLWIIILPISVLFIAEHFRLLLSFLLNKSEKKNDKTFKAIFITLIHLSFGLFISKLPHVIISSYLTIFLSWMFFMNQIFLWHKLTFNKILLILFFIIAIHPIEVYSYLNNNARKYAGPGMYDLPYRDLCLVKPNFQKKEEQSKDFKVTRANLYISTKNYYTLFRNVDYEIFLNYTGKKFIIYDNVRASSDNNINWDTFKRDIAEMKNIAIVASNKDAKEYINTNNVSDKAMIIESESRKFMIEEYKMTSIKLRTNFNSRKFLVYNDTFYPGWKTFINRKETDILRANVAFKGIWLPPGENIVEFVFKPNNYYVWRWVLLIIYYSTLITIIFLWLRRDIDVKKTIN